jgi:YegS/Rv2252/BmrU family lipid kinase
LTRVALVVNRASGGGRADPADLEDELRRSGTELCRFGVDELAEAVAWRPDRIVVAGGDGSVGAAAVAATRASLTLAVIPTGTANDFARALDLPDDAFEACRLAATGTVRRAVDLGHVGELAFVNVVSAGLAVAAAREAKSSKVALGPLAYAVGALRAGMTARPIECRVACDGDELFAGRAWQVIVANTGAFGGGAEVESASPFDGLLTVVVIEAGPRARLIQRAYGLRRGRITNQRGVRWRDARSVRVQVPDGVAFNVDGEIRRLGVSPELSVEPGAFQLLVPGTDG